MKKFKKIMRSPVTTALLFLIAAGLLLTSTIGGTRAALQYFSEDYTSQVELFEIGVTLNENGDPVSSRDYAVNNPSGNGDESYWNKTQGVLCGTMLEDAGDDSLKLGKKYTEEISVTNSGKIDEFVRVTIYKYWVETDDNEKEKKRQDLDPSLIDLNFVHDNGNGWLMDSTASTDERSVFYYDRAVASGDTTNPVTDTLMIDPSIIKDAQKEEVKTWVKDGRTYTSYSTTYLYDGKEFRIEAEVDAVQTHNAQKAIHSAWGPYVNISGDSLSLG